MVAPLQSLFAAIDSVNDERNLKTDVTSKLGEHFAATRSGIFFFDQISQLDPNLQKILKVALSIKRNPIARYLTERHAPVHEGLVTSPKVWSLICPRPDHWHVMAGPIVVRGQLVGAVGCTRDQSKPAFDIQNLADLSGICLHLSIWAATVRSQNASTGEPQHQFFRIDLLTSRELQIAELVALGRTNAEIGKEIWIAENSVKQALKRIFCKLEVSSRTEMVTKLFTFQNAASNQHNLLTNSRSHV
jgi:DNA-binding CsgD family transcriptional regulator